MRRAGYSEPYGHLDKGSLIPFSYPFSPFTVILEKEGEYEKENGLIQFEIAQGKP